jgi:nucleoside-diphosphate-sugar epimerase
MKILVTGGAGFIGSMLVPELLKEGHSVTVLDNLMWGSQGLSCIFSKPRFRLVEGDVLDGKLVGDAMKGKDVVIHLAALVGYNLCERNRQRATDVNVQGSKIVEEQLSDKQLLIYASTGSIYGPVNCESCTEDMAPNPQSHYASTKAEAESIFSKRKNAVTLRFATAFGISFRMRLDLLVNQFVYEAVKNRVLVVYEKDFVRPVIHVSDIAQSILFAISNRQSMQGGTFNVGSEALTFTKREIALRIKKQFDYNLNFAETNSDPDRRNYRFSTQKIEALGYRPTVSLDTGIGELICAVTQLKIDKSCFNA